MGYNGRDVEVCKIEDGWCLVASCDSCGAVGSKQRDIIQVPAQLVGRLTARVSLMEVVSVGALPRVMSVAVCAEPEPTGREILEGVRQELGSAGLKDLALVVSTEKNFTPAQTGLGIGVTGTCREDSLRIAGSGDGDAVYLLGLPRLGDEVARALDTELVGIPHIRRLLNTPGIHDVVPVGSRGILAEARDLAAVCDTRFIPASDLDIDLEKPAGPSTCAVFTAGADWEPDLSPGPKVLPDLFPIGRLGPG